MSPAMCLFGRPIRDLIPTLPTRLQQPTQDGTTWHTRQTALKKRQSLGKKRCKGVVIFSQPAPWLCTFRGTKELNLTNESVKLNSTCWVPSNPENNQRKQTQHFKTSYTLPLPILNNLLDQTSACELYTSHPTKGG